MTTFHLEQYVYAAALKHISTSILDKPSSLNVRSFTKNWGITAYNTSRSYEEIIASNKKSKKITPIKSINLNAKFFATRSPYYEFNLHKNSNKHLIDLEEIEIY